MNLPGPIDPAAPAPSPASREDARINAMLDEARIPLPLKGAAIALAGAGLLVLLTGVQNLTLVSWNGVWMLLPLLLTLAGAVAIGVGAKLVRGRAWTLVGGVAASAVLVLATVGFVVLALVSGVFSLLAVAGVGGAIVALVLTLLAIGPFRAILATRRRLRDAGYDLDL